MTGIALVMIAISIGDLVAGGLTGESTSVGRVALGTICAIGAPLIVIPATDLSAEAAAGILIVTALVGFGWLLCKLGLGRRADDHEVRSAQRWAQAALAVVGLGLLAAVALAPTLHGDVPALTAWVRSLPFPGAGETSGGDVLALVAILLFLTAPANSIVRTLLTAASSEWRASEQKLRGGRFIGVLERWLIFGLALAGEATAAALVVSAKSLLRFPELSQAARESDETQDRSVAGIDQVTEYFLLGSLTSWALALVVVPLLA